MTEKLTVKTYPSLPEINRNEVLRYLHAKGDEPTKALIEEVIGELDGKLSYKVIYKSYSICREECSYDLGFANVKSTDLDRALFGCDSIILFAATLGAGADRMISRYSSVLPSRALVIDAICTERIEALCDAFEREITKDRYSRPRYSPGYGDVPIEIQRDVFRALELQSRFGLVLNDSMLVTPTKTVSAFIGLGRRNAK